MIGRAPLSNRWFNESWQDAQTRSSPEESGANRAVQCRSADGRPQRCSSLPQRGRAAPAELAPAGLRPSLPSRRARPIRPHDLRHTAASLAIRGGANSKAVQRMLGHASAAMTLDVCAGRSTDDLDSVAIALDAFVPPLCHTQEATEIAFASHAQPWPITSGATAVKWRVGFRLLVRWNDPPIEWMTTYCFGLRTPSPPADHGQPRPGGSRACCGTRPGPVRASRFAYVDIGVYGRLHEHVQTRT